MIAARALEQFLEELITKTASITTSLQAKTLTPEHIRQHIYTDTRLSFLHDLANRMATGPTNPASRTLSTSSASSATAISTNRPALQQQLSIPYQDPLPSTTSSNITHLNHQMSRPYYSKVSSKKRSFDLVDDEEDDDDDDDEDNDDSNDGHLPAT